MGHYDEFYEAELDRQRKELLRRIEIDRSGGRICSKCDYTYSEHVGVNTISSSVMICPTAIYEHKKV